MAYVSYDKVWKGKFYNSVSAKERVRDINQKRLKLKVNDTYKKDEKITANFEPIDDPDSIYKTYPDTILSEIEEQIPYTAKSTTNIKYNNKQSVEEILIERAVKKTIKMFSDKILFYNSDNARDIL